MRLSVFGRVGGGVVATFVAAAVSTTGGCTATQPTELVPGIVSQIQVPRNLREIRVDLQADGEQATCYWANVNPTTGGVTLPKTLGVIPGASTSNPVTVTITGYAVDDTIANPPQVLEDCDASPFDIDGTNTGKYDPAVMILRRSRQTYVDTRTLFLPMPLRYSCWAGPGCTNTQTCVAGVCVDANIDASTLADFQPSMVDGTDDTCFSPTTCFADKAPAEVVDAATCLYQYPVEITNDPGTGLNVRVYYDGAEAEVLDVDPVEGFTIPDATKPRQFLLAPGLCAMINGTNPMSPRQIVGVDVATACASKHGLQAICSDQQPGNDPQTLPDGGTSTDGSCNVANNLEPAPSALYILLDDSKDMAPIFGQMGLSQVLSFSLEDPAFRETSVAFSLLPHDMADCTASPGSLATPINVPFALAQLAQGSIATVVGKTANVLSTDPPLYIDAALSPTGAYKALTDFAAMGNLVYNRLAVLLIENRTIPTSPTDCGATHLAPDLESANAYSMNGIYTYVVMLGTDVSTTVMDDTEARAIATNGGPVGNNQYFDARTNAAVGAAAFNAIASDLGACLYEKPANINSSATVAYTNPLTQQSTTIPFDATCTDAATTTGAGWSIDAADRIRICGQPCTTLRSTLSNAANAALAMNLSAPSIPVTATQLCSGTTAADGGSSTMSDGAIAPPADAALQADAGGETVDAEVDSASP
jgi:hypothetical protein